MANNEENDNKKPSMQGLSFAYRISTELLGALIVSVVIGLLIDKMSVSYTHLTLPTT